MKEQPVNFGFGEDETRLRDAVRKFLADNSGADKLHAQVAADSDIHRPIECIWDQSLWHQIVELGWTAVCVPESAGGLGMALVAGIAIAEEVGKAALPSPLLSTYCATAVLDACTSDAAIAALSDIASGTPTTLATTNRAGSWNSSDTDVEVRGGKLNGSTWFVQDAKKCDRYIVSAHGEGGVGLYQVDAAAAGLDIVPDGIIDLTRDQAHLTFDGVEAVELAAPGSGAAAIDQATPTILTLLSADMVGGSEWLLQTTVQYAKDRVQFDRQLGFFQAVKHPLVNVMLDLDQAKSLVYNAACSIDCGEDSAELNARMAKSIASDTAVFASSRAVQFHGGIGFTWESYVHVHFKRQMHSHVMFGDGKFQRAALANLVIGKVP